MLECSFQLWWRSGSKDKVMKTRHLVLRIKIQARSKILASQALPPTNQHLAWKSWSVATQAWIVKLSANLTFLSFDPFNGWRKKSWIQQNLCSIWLISTIKWPGRLWWELQDDAWAATASKAFHKMENRLIRLKRAGRSCHSRQQANLSVSQMWRGYARAIYLQHLQSI